MQVEQKNIWEDVTRNAKRDNSNRAIAAYQANMPDAGAVAAFGGQEAYVQQKTAVSEAGNIDMATYSNPAKQGQEEKTVAEKIAGQEISSGQARSNEIAVVANTTSTEDLKKMEEDGFSISDADSHTIITVTDKIKDGSGKSRSGCVFHGRNTHKGTVRGDHRKSGCDAADHGLSCGKRPAGDGGKCAGQCRRHWHRLPRFQRSRNRR